MTASIASSGKLGLFTCITLLIGTMVGSAIFSLSGLTILQSGPAAILSWLLAGLVMLGYGMCMGELACRYPRSGGVYYFPRLAFPGRLGTWLGWLSCWSFIITNIVAIAFSAIYVGIYASIAFPAASGHQLSIAWISIAVCLVLNLIRFELAGRINSVIVFILLTAMGIYVVSAFGSAAYSRELLVPFFSQGTGGSCGFLRSIPVALIGYSGIVALAFMVSEVKNANRNVPLAMLIAISFVILLYAASITATLGLVASADLQKNPGMCFIPMFFACFSKLQSVPYLASVVSIAAVLALMTTMLICVSINARAIQAAGEDKLLPGFCAKTAANGSPAAAVLLTCLIAMIYAGFPKYTNEIVNFGAVFNIITMLLSLLALIKSRRTGPVSSFQVPGGPAVPYLVLVILLACNGVGLFGRNDRRLWCYTAFFLVLGAVVKLLRFVGRRGR